MEEEDGKQPKLFGRAAEARIEDRTALVGIIGLGYVGLPLALTFAEKGFRVLGFDVDPKKVDALNARRELHRAHRRRARLARADRRPAASRPPPTSSASREPDAILICVPTPLTPQREPDMSYVVDTARRSRRGCARASSSSSSPRPTRARPTSWCAAMLEEPGLRCGQDFFLAFSPEREDPGNANVQHGDDPQGRRRRRPAVAAISPQALYDQVDRERPCASSTPRDGRGGKLLENIFRAVNIALVNELKIVYDRMGIDVWEVIDAAATKPFGFMRFNPGPAGAATASRSTRST